MSIKIDKLMNLFLEDSYSEFNLREVARIAKLNPMTASKYLKYLLKESVIKKRPERNFILFSADTESERFKDMKRCFNIKKIRSSGLVEYIEKELSYPEVIILFGSYAKAENSAESDIDIFILSESNKKLDLSVFESRIGAEIQIFKHSRKEFDAMKRDNKELLNNILNGVCLSGFLEVFK
ncbi:MAG: nucleotidyltransferase domain-containing protein [Candidatus Aenigmarchaeota archaeon]|nr:nucleotidyltransferase domain-containing protein [Candidatus Aenigmarchaeota archaeon]